MPQAAFSDTYIRLQILWMRDDAILAIHPWKDPLFPRRAISQFNNTWNFHIKNVQPDDAGEYMCIGIVFNFLLRIV